APRLRRILTYGISPGARSLPQVRQSVFADDRRRGYPGRGLLQYAPSLRLRRQSQYPLEPVRLGTEASPRAPLRRVPALLNFARCPGWSKSQGRPRARAWVRSPSKAPIVFRLAPGQDLIIQ